MDIKEYKKLEDKINTEDYHHSYRNIDRVMFYLSIFGNLCSIFLAYFLVETMLSNSITNPIASNAITIVFLVGLELMKREIFDKFSLHYLRYGFAKGIMFLFIGSLIVISLSFYSSVAGAKELASEQKEIDIQTEAIVSNYSDSLTNIYTIKIQDLEEQVRISREKINDKDEEQTKLEAVQPLGWQQRARVRDLKTEKSELKEDIDKYEQDISNLKSELETKISSYEEESVIESVEAKEENESNIIFFLIISSLIELLIIGGVYFNEYYKYRSYREFKAKLESDPNYQSWMLYNSLLDLIYSGDTKLNDKLPSVSFIMELGKSQNIILLKKDVESMIKVLSSLGILKVSGSAKYIAKGKQVSEEIIRKYFNIKGGV